MATISSMSNMISNLNYFQKSNSISDITSPDYALRQFQKLAVRFQNNPGIGSVVKNDAYNLKLTTQGMQKSNKNLYINSKAVESSSTAISGTAQNGAINATHSFKVTQIAQAQSNKGISFTSNAASSLSQGTHSFKITVEDKTKDISFSVNNGETNQQSLEKMAKAINDSHGSVTAKVVNDEKNKTSSIQITNNTIGVKNIFEISDNVGNAVATTGTGAASVKATDAAYTMDGKDYTSQANSILVDNGKVNITFNGVTDKEVTVKVTEDKDAIHKSINNFVTSFNGLVNSINSPQGLDFSNNIGKELGKITGSERNQLSSIGISVQKDGTLKVDEEKLETAIKKQPSKVKDIFGGFGEIASKASKFADRILVGVFDANGPSFDATDFSTYFKNGIKTNYAQNSNIGIFVNLLL